MTVRELRDWCDDYISHGGGDVMTNDTQLDRLAYEERCNVEVKLFTSDGRAEDIADVKTTDFERMVAPAVYADEMVVDRRCAFCSKCRNMVEGSETAHDRTDCIMPRYTIDCNNPRVGMIRGLRKYRGGECIDYDPKVPTYVMATVEKEPAKYGTETVVGLFAENAE